jgi:1-acyl-sn-glycerol-3-phosphate acyltransferase
MPSFLAPRIVRRLLVPVYLVLYVVLFALSVLLLPVLFLVALVVSSRLPGHYRAVRLLFFFLTYLLFEIVGMIVAFVLWVASGFGWKVRGYHFQLAHYAVLRLGFVALVRVAERLFRLELVLADGSWSPLDDGVPGSENAMIIAARHAGPGESVLLIETLMNREHLRKPRMVAKDLLQLDPAIDLFFNRIPNRFIDPQPGSHGSEVEESIASLAAGLTDTDALLIFPEGGNFTDRRRTKAIERLRGHGLESMAQRAEAMATVLAPKPGGLLAAHRAAPHADMIFVAHTGIEHLSTVRDIWHGLPQEKTLYLRWSFIPAADIPDDEDEFVDWLYDWWADIDAWIRRHDLPSSQLPE